MKTAVIYEDGRRQNLNLCEGGASSRVHVSVRAASVVVTAEVVAESVAESGAAMDDADFLRLFGSTPQLSVRSEASDLASQDARLYLLAIGGWDSRFQRLQRVDALEWSATAFPAPVWRSLPPLLAARCGGAACVTADGAVLAVGGMGEKSAEVSRVASQ